MMLVSTTCALGGRPFARNAQLDFFLIQSLKYVIFRKLLAALADKLNCKRLYFHFGFVPKADAQRLYIIH
jgi:hypothetical protein